RREERREFRQVFLEMIVVESELDRLCRLDRETHVVSPVSGRIHFGISASQSVRTNDTVAHIWPDDGELLVEVSGPLAVVHQLIRANRVEAIFPTADGNMEVIGRPLPSSLRTHLEEVGPRNEREIWGFLQCRAVSIPQSLRVPGLIGKLQ
ncbi:MAG: hypothetical protein ACC655_09865, partial [Rhodothermia bacterium]